MEDVFLIPVEYKGEQRNYEASLHVMGYTHKFHVMVEDLQVIYERDEEGAYRAIIDPETKVKLPAADLLQAIAESIERILA